MRELNFIRGRYKKHLLAYLGIDLIFMAFVAFVLMFGVSIVLSWSSGDQIRVESYTQMQITKLNGQAKEYAGVKESAR